MAKQWRKATIPMRRRVAIPPGDRGNGIESLGGYQIVQDGTREVRYEITWLPARLDAMVRKAAGNKSGQSMDGPIVVTIHPADRKGVQK